MHMTLPTSILGRAVALFLTGCAVLLFLVFLVVTIAPLRMVAVRSVLTIAGASPPTDAAGYTNLLLLGVGDKHHDGADLTDTMMIASIDPESRSVVLVSIPRDLYMTGSVDLPDGRINTLYVYEKSLLRQKNKKLTDEELSDMALRELGDIIGKKFGVKIHGVIKTDFTAFVNTVDALGGVDVDVKQPITDYTYPIEEKVTGLFHLDAGLQHFDGETALKFARSRHSGTDFDRSLRQQQLIQAISQKLQTMNHLEQISFAKSVLNNVVSHFYSTLSTSELLGLTQIGTELSRENIVMMQMNFNSGSDYIDAKAGGFLYVPDPALYENASVLLPSTLSTDKSGWGQMRTFVSLLVYHRNLYLANQHLQVANVSASSLNAYRLENELRRYGFIVDPAPKAPKTTGTTEKPAPLDASFITHSPKADADVAAFFGTLLGMPVSKPDAASTTGTGQLIRIVLGKDYKYRPFQVIGTGSILQ